MSNLEELYEQDFSAWIERNAGVFDRSCFPPTEL
jgi:hypothetical protein